MIQDRVMHNPTNPPAGAGCPGRVWLAILCLLPLCLLAAGADALMVPEDLGSLSAGADDIVRGTVTETASHWSADHRAIVTTARVAVAKSLRGRYTGGTVAITVPGGTVGDVTQWVEDQPALVPGQDAYFFVTQHPRWGTTVHGAHLGVVPVRNGRVWWGDRFLPRGVTPAWFEQHLADLANGRVSVPPADAVTLTGMNAPVITGVSPTSASAGTGTVVTITGSGFGTKPSRYSAADVGFVSRYSGSTTTMIWASGAPDYGVNANDIVNWTDTEVRVRVPVGRTLDGYDGSASSGYLYVKNDDGAESERVPFATTFGFARRQWSAPAVYLVNANCGDVPDEAAAVERAGATWNRAMEGADFRFEYGGPSTGNRTERNGESLIYWGPASDFTSPNTIAWATQWSEGGRITEADIEFNSAFTFTTGTASGAGRNIEAIVLHELGHWLSLRDLYGWLPGYPSDIGKVMFGYSSESLFDNLNLRTLHAADIAGAQYIYGGTSHAAPDLAPLTFVPPAGAVGRTFAIAGRVTNQGTGAAGPFVVHFCLSPDATITTSDTVIGNRSFPGLAAGAASAEIGTDATVPASVPPGTYYLGMVVDPADAVAETNEQNNTVAGAAPIILPGVVPGGAGLPTDTDRDGRYDDVNGNGRKDFADVGLYFNQMAWIAANEPVGLFDYNANGRVDFADAVWLFNRL